MGVFDMAVFFFFFSTVFLWYDSCEGDCGTGAYRFVMMVIVCNVKIGRAHV